MQHSPMYHYVTTNRELPPPPFYQVTDAQHHEVGRSKYTTYLVEVLSPIKSASRRRYSDFTWLYHRLLDERAGAIVPIIPHKKALMGKVRFSEELVTERQGQLQRFLERVMTHPDLHDAPSVQSFLTADYTIWENIKKAAGGDTIGDEDDSEGASADNGESPSKPTAGNRVTNWIGKVASNARMAMGSMQLESTPDDDIFNDLHSYASNLDANIKILAKDATALVASIKTQGETMEQMSAAFSEMGQYTLQNEVVVRSHNFVMFSKLGTNWNNLSKLSHFCQLSAQTKLDDPIQDLARDVAALQKAIAKRKHMLFLYTRKANQGKQKMGQLDKLRENAANHPEKIAGLEGDIRTLKEEGAQAWQDVDTVSKRLQRDVERFKVTFHEGMRKTMETFHKVQVEYSEKYMQGWNDVLPSLLPATGDVAQPTSPPPVPPTGEDDDAITATI
jgi:sorting nexin-1/2